jgi:predicted metal-dependent phosphoesterase TrpH
VIDLHTHSTVSDGTDSPAALVELAARAGLHALAITDHDTLDHVRPAADAAARHDVRLVPGCEISCAVPPDVSTMHLLVYFPDAEGPLAPRLRELQDARSTRNDRIVERLRDAGIDITVDDVLAEAGDGSVGRPHIAAVLVRAGAASSIDDAFDRWLAKGRPAYVERLRLSPREAIALAHGSRAVTSLAHPGSLGLEGGALRAFAAQLAADGLDAVECEYARYTREERGTYRALAAEFGLAVTGGSDYHGAYKPDLHVGVGRGDLAVPDALLDDLEARRPV